MFPDKEPAIDPTPVVIIDPAGAKVVRNKRRWLIGEFLAYFVVILIIIMLYAYYIISANVEYYLLSHVLAELFSIVILGSIFIIGWHTKYIARNSFFLVIGVSALFVALIDILHTLAFPGMGFFTDVSPGPGIDYNIAPQLWVAARYFQSIAILTSLLVMRKKVRPFITFLVAAVACALVLLAIFTRIFPLAHDGTSLTPFKVASEYVIIGLLGTSGLLAWKERTFFTALSFRLIIAFLSFMVASELLFTLYAGAYEPTNMLGHVFKIAAFACAYKAIVQSVLEKPLDGLFKRLIDADQSLERRNRELVSINSSLIHEITEREKAEGILRQFISTISHEIRTPVTVLGQSVQNLVKYSEQMSTEQETALVAAISRNMGIMTNLVDDFNTLIRIDDHKEQLSTQDVNVYDIALDVVRLMDNTTRAKDMKLTVSGDEGLVFPVDEWKIRMIVFKLVDNAVKFSPLGTHISIQVKDRYVGEYNRDGQDGMLLQVSDSGMGIEADFLPRLYDRFARSPRVCDIPGSGLGLAIAKELIEIHGGKIHVATQVDKGTTFSVFLPRPRYPSLREDTL